IVINDADPTEATAVLRETTNDILQTVTSKQFRINGQNIGGKGKQAFNVTAVLVFEGMLILPRLEQYDDQQKQGKQCDENAQAFKGEGLFGKKIHVCWFRRGSKRRAVSVAQVQDKQ
ncbi:MAG: hypothetical protein HN608_05810, partial [Rhodospirillaceae bacterium]|nr:hypothetical protein [Rhodospirillaceae bacterium]